MRPTRPPVRLAVLAAVLLAVPGVLLAGGPMAAADEAGVQEDRDLSASVPGGQYRAYEVELLGDGRIQAGGIFRGLVTDQPVLPLIVTVEKDGEPYNVVNRFGYDTVGPNNPYEYGAWLRTPVGDLQSAQFEIRGGGWSTFPAPAGVYRVVVAWGPGEGTVDMRLQFLDAPSVVRASDAGRTFFTRGIDASDTGLDAFFAAGSMYLRTWRYSEAEVPFEVQGRMYAYTGILTTTNAHWVSPEASTWPSFVVNGPPGAWKAVFPEASHMGPMCVQVCWPSDGTIEDPPFAIAADVRL